MLLITPSHGLCSIWISARPDDSSQGTSAAGRGGGVERDGELRSAAKVRYGPPMSNGGGYPVDIMVVGDMRESYFPVCCCTDRMGLSWLWMHVTATCPPSLEISFLGTVIGDSVVVPSVLWAPMQTQRWFSARAKAAGTWRVDYREELREHRKK